MQKRKTQQFLQPLQKSKLIQNTYDIYPAFDIGDGKILSGFESIVKEIKNEKIIIIDGYIGVLWDEFKANMVTHFNKKIKFFFLFLYK